MLRLLANVEPIQDHKQENLCPEMPNVPQFVQLMYTDILSVRIRNSMVHVVLTFLQCLLWDTDLSIEIRPMTFGTFYLESIPVYHSFGNRAKNNDKFRCDQCLTNSEIIVHYLDNKGY